MRKRLVVKWIAVLAFFSFPFLLGAAWAQTETVLYSFCPQHGCTDGLFPEAGLVFDQQGNLYGTTNLGGVSGASCQVGLGCGTIFKLTPDGTETVLHNFCAQNECADGAFSVGGLVFDQEGNLYGTAPLGGSHGRDRCSDSGITGCGVVFKLTPEGKYTVLYNFCALGGCKDGAKPGKRLLLDRQGNLYGTTFSGGANRLCGYDKVEGCGVVFKLTPQGKETVPYTFCVRTNCADGSNPAAGLTVDKQGNFYGTTLWGGNPNCYFASYGCGVVFKLTPRGRYTVLHTFCTGGSRCNDGALPEAGVIVDRRGNVYGTTSNGGSSPHSVGVVFKLTPKGKETTLYSFSCSQENCSHGESPSRITFGPDGNLHGTTYGGGAYDQGTVFELTPDGKETVLYSFCPDGGSCPDGEEPVAGLIFDQQGNMFGTTHAGGTFQGGTVFKITR